MGIYSTKIANELPTSLGLKRGPNGFFQTKNNCFEIANNLAVKFGFLPLSEAEIYSKIMGKRRRSWEYINTPNGLKLQININPLARSPGCLVIRSGDSDIHITFELKGKDFNYGAGRGRSDFKIESRIPLVEANIL